MKNPTFSNYGTTAFLIFVAFIVLGSYTMKLQQKTLELQSDTASMGLSYRIAVYKHDSIINDTVNKINKRCKFIKASVE